MEFTKKWIKRNYSSIDVSNENAQQVMDKVLITAFVELLVWEDTKQDLYPETLLMDESRFTSLRNNVSLYTLVGSVMLVTFATVPSVQQLAAFKDTLKSHLMLILGEEAEERVRLSPLESRLESASLQVMQDVKGCLEKHGLPNLDSSKEASLRTQICDLAKPENRVRLVIQRRVLEFVEGIAASNTASPVQIPSGLSVLQEELSSLAGSFLRVLTHNRAVFGEHYAEIVNSLKTSQNI